MNRPVNTDRVFLMTISGVLAALAALGSSAAIVCQPPVDRRDPRYCLPPQARYTGLPFLGFGGFVVVGGLVFGGLASPERDARIVHAGIAPARHELGSPLADQGFRA